jgi:hypothetical protein
MTCADDMEGGFLTAIVDHLGLERGNKIGIHLWEELASPKTPSRTLLPAASAMSSSRRRDMEHRQTGNGGVE